MTFADSDREMISIYRAGANLQTEGLARHGRKELRVNIGSAPIHGYEEYLRVVADYAVQKPILDGETVRHGFWLTKMILTSDGFLDAWEYRKQGDEFVRGIDLAVSYWDSQHRVCDDAGVEFTPPLADQKAAVSPEVLEGERFSAVRYPSPPHMSGWWFLSPNYDGDVQKLKVIHLYHVTAGRDDIAPFLALPFGYRFDGGRVWFDPEILEDE